MPFFLQKFSAEILPAREAAIHSRRLTDPFRTPTIKCRIRPLSFEEAIMGKINWVRVILGESSPG